MRLDIENLLKNGWYFETRQNKYYLTPSDHRRFDAANYLSIHYLGHVIYVPNWANY